MRRVEVEVGPGRKVSSLVWGTSAPELVLVHGGAQNAHTWDTVAMMLDRPLVAIDLPGHGHSDGGPDGSLSLASNGADLATGGRRPGPRCGRRGRHVPRWPLLHRPGGARPRAGPRPRPGRRDPGGQRREVRPHPAFVNGPDSFADFDELLARTIEHNPTRSVSSLRRGILHNAVQREDGSWVWRYARFRAEGERHRAPTSTKWWDAISG